MYTINIPDTDADFQKTRVEIMGEKIDEVAEKSPQQQLKVTRQ
jgi:hypothetical protein